MGMSKYDHIKEILSDKYVCRNWTINIKISRY